MNQSLISKLRVLLELPKNSPEHYEGLNVNFFANNSAEPKQIQNVIAFFKERLPNEYIDFLKLYNGCELYKLEDIGGFNFLSTEMIMKENDFHKKEYGDAWDDSIIFFCECLGEGNFIGFRPLENGKYLLLDCFHEEKPSEWRPIGDSFDVFLEKLIDLKGEKFWLTQ
jgi:hypothetical protein